MVQILDISCFLWPSDWCFWGNWNSKKFLSFIYLSNFHLIFLFSIYIIFTSFIHSFYEKILLCNVKLANSASPFKFRQVKFQQKTGLENDKMGFSQRETGYNWHCLWKTHFIILNKSSRPVFCGKLTWWNLKGLAELPNLTVQIFQVFFFKQKTAYEISLGLVGSEMCIRDRSQQEFKTSFLWEIDLTEFERTGGIS